MQTNKKKLQQQPQFFPSLEFSLQNIVVQKRLWHLEDVLWCCIQTERRKEYKEDHGRISRRVTGLEEVREARAPWNPFRNLFPFLHDGGEAVPAHMWVHRAYEKWQARGLKLHHRYALVKGILLTIPWSLINYLLIAEDRLRVTRTGVLMEKMRQWHSA